MYQVIIFFRNKAAKLAQTPSLDPNTKFITGRSKVRNFQTSRRISIFVSLDRS